MFGVVEGEVELDMVDEDGFTGFGDIARSALDLRQAHARLGDCDGGAVREAIVFRQLARSRIGSAADVLTADVPATDVLALMAGARSLTEADACERAVALLQSEHCATPAVALNWPMAQRWQLPGCRGQRLLAAPRSREHRLAAADDYLRGRWQGFNTGVIAGALLQAAQSLLDTGLHPQAPPLPPVPYSYEPCYSVSN